MNQRYIDYAHYNIWANDRLIHDLNQQDENILTQELVGSFPTIFETIRHIWFAEVGWLSRLNHSGWKVEQVTEFSGTHQELFHAWQKTSKEFRDFVYDADLEVLIPFKHKGIEFSIPGREIVQTVFNHGTYHRGQVVMMMRQLGVTAISQTDYIEWVREIARKNLQS